MHYIKKHQDRVLIIIISILSLISFIHFYLNSTNLFYDDGLSRLDIARKITDNLTPGIGQLGNVWLPLPFLLMQPFILSRFFWHSGIAWALISMPAYILGCYFIYKSIKLLTKSVFISLCSLSI